MYKGLALGIVLAMASSALGASFTGRLIDAQCADLRPEASCNPTAATKQFALVSSGKLLRFDTDGNTKTAEALVRRNKQRTNEEQLPDSANGVNAIVQGEASGYQISVRDIKIQ